MKSNYNLVEVILAVMVASVGIAFITALITVSNGPERQNANAVDAGEQFLNFYSAKISSNKNTFDMFPDSKPVTHDAIIWKDESEIKDTKIEILRPIIETPGVFRLKQNTKTIADFDSLIKAWFERNGGILSLIVEVSYPIEVPYYRRSFKLFKRDFFLSDLGVHEGVLSGAININPGGRGDSEFQVVYDGRFVTFRDLQYDFVSDNASFIIVRPKGEGNQNTLRINDRVVKLNNSMRYILIGRFDINVYKERGSWFIEIDGKGEMTER